MEAIAFTTKDTEILYALPKPPSDVKSIIQCFMFINRSAPPTYEEFLECLSKAARSGMIEVNGGRVNLTEEWYRSVHKADETADNEIEAMLEFADTLLGKQFTPIANFEVFISSDEYTDILDSLK